MQRILSSLALTLLLTAAVHAQVPRTISYQGVLADATGALVPDGNHQLTLRLYDQATAATPLFEEVQTVAVVRGLFNAILGSVTPIPPSLRFDRAYFLGVSVNGGGELVPRTTLTSVPYALRAAVADVAEAVAPGASGVVTSVNGRSGTLTIEGAGGTTVTGSGGTITISSSGSGGTGIQGVQAPDGSIGVTNPNGPVATLAIAAGGVRSVHIADGSITASDIAAGVIPNTTGFLASGSTAGGALAGTYPNPALAPGAVSTQALAQGAVTADIIAPGTVVRSINSLRDDVTLAAGSNVTITPSGSTLTIAATGGGGGGIQRVQNTNQTLDVIDATGPTTTINVRANAIATSHLRDGAVTAAKLAPGALPASLPPSGAAGGDLTGSYPNPTLAADAVETAAIANGAVTLPKISSTGAAAGKVISYNGSAVVWGDAGLSGSGAANQIAYFTGSGTLASSSVLRHTAGSNPTFVFGGAGSSATGQYAAVIGGGNVVSADYGIAIAPGGATVSGSQSMAFGSSSVSGIRSIVIGNFVNCTHNGSLMMGDNTTSTTLNSAASNSFSARYAGGYRLYSNATLTTGVTMAAGTSGWTNVCDRSLKENVRSVDGEAVLAALRDMPVTEWNYWEADPSIRYMGPMAQDFHRAFGLGGSDSTGINSINADGVAMAAIKALERRTTELRLALEARDAELAILRERLARYASRK